MRYLMIGCFMLLLHSCIGRQNPPEPDSEQTNVTMQVKSAGGSPIMKADGSTDREIRIDNLSVLVFLNENGNETFSYKANVSKISYNTETALYELSVRLQKSIDDEKYTLVLIANHDLPNSMANAKGMPKEDILSSLTFASNLSGNNYVWYNAADKAFPMWGEAKPQTITEFSSFEMIPLLRAVAKIDIRFSNEQGDITELTDAADNLYSLESVYLYRSRSQGRTIPDASAVTEFYTEDIKVDASTLVSGDTFNEPVLFSFASTTTVLENTIYLAESEAGEPKDTEATTSLVLGIKNSSFTNNSSGVDPNTRYFRADINNKGEVNTRAILRNHRYIVGILAVEGIGSETPDEADKGTSEGTITVSVSDWEFVNPDLIVSGEQKFSISQRTVDLEKAGGLHVLTFTTNLPAGKVKLQKSEIANFGVELDFDGKKITVSSNGENNTGIPIQETFYILAGEMKISVRIYQAG